MPCKMLVILEEEIFGREGTLGDTKGSSRYSHVEPSYSRIWGISVKSRIRLPSSKRLHIL